MPVSTITEQVNDMFTTTWYNMRSKVEDNIFTTTALLAWLKANGRVFNESGGRDILIPVEYAENDTVQAMTKGGTISISPQEIVTDAKYPWAYLAGSVVRYKIEELQNASKARLFNYVKIKLQNLEKTLQGKIESQLFDGAGLGTSGEVVGLGEYLDVSTYTSDSPGGIDRSTYTWWRPKVTQMTALYATNQLDGMEAVFYNCADGNDTPDLLVADVASYRQYAQLAQDVQRVVNTTLADLSFDHLTFKGKPMIWSSDAITTGTYPSGGTSYPSIQFLNTKYMYWYQDPAANFSMTQWKEPANQVGDQVAQVMVAGQLVFSNCAKQGVLYNTDRT